MERKDGFVVGFTDGRFNTRQAARLAEKNYGVITDTREMAFAKLCVMIRRLAGKRKIIICTDRKKEYRTWIGKYLPAALHYGVLSSGAPNHRDEQTDELRLISDSFSYQTQRTSYGELILSSSPITRGMVSVQQNAKGRAHLTTISYTHKKEFVVKEFRGSYKHLYRIDHYLGMRRQHLARMKRRTLSTSKTMRGLIADCLLHLAYSNCYPLFRARTPVPRPTTRNGYRARGVTKFIRLFKDIMPNYSDVKQMNIEEIGVESIEIAAKE